MLKNKMFRAPLMLIAMLVLTAASRFIDPAILGYDDTLYLSIVILQLVAVALPAVFYAKSEPSGYVKKLGLTPIAPTRLWFFGISLLLLLSGSSVIRLIMANLGNTASIFGDYSAVAASSMSSVSDVIYVIVALAIVPAICQEFAFRSILLTEYREYGALCAVVITALASSMLQFDLPYFFLYFYNAAIYAFAVYITKSSLSALLLHLCYNTLNLFFEKYLIRIVSQSEYATLNAFILISLFLFSLFLAFSEAERLTSNDAIVEGEKEEEEEEDAPFRPNGYRRSFDTFRPLLKAIISPTFLICIALFLLGMLIP